MAKTKKQIIDEGVALVDEMEILEVITEAHKTVLGAMTEELKVVELQAMFNVLKEDHESAIGQVEGNKIESDYQPVWRCGIGSRELIIAAPDKAAALNELCEIEPVFKAIGCVAEPMVTVEGHPLFALIKE